jgi:hypothetical protein
MVNPPRDPEEASRVPHEVPEDVRSEQDADHRRRRVEAPLSVPPGEVPENALSDLDGEARRAAETARQRETEGRPPAEEEVRS